MNPRIQMEPQEQLCLGKTGLKQSQNSLPNTPPALLGNNLKKSSTCVEEREMKQLSNGLEHMDPLEQKEAERLSDPSPGSRESGGPVSPTEAATRRKEDDPLAKCVPTWTHCCDEKQKRSKLEGRS